MKANFSIIHLQCSCIYSSPLFTSLSPNIYSSLFRFSFSSIIHTRVINSKMLKSTFRNFLNHPIEIRSLDVINDRIFEEEKSIDLENCDFVECIALGGLFNYISGGAIFSYKSNVTINFCRIYSCCATYAGAFALIQSNTTITHSSLSENSATSDCGCIWCIYGNNFNISDTNMSSNHAEKYSGNILLSFSSCDIDNSIFKNNTACYSSTSISIVSDTTSNLKRIQIHDNISSINCTLFFQSINDNSLTVYFDNIIIISQNQPHIRTFGNVYLIFINGFCIKNTELIIESENGSVIIDRTPKPEEDAVERCFQYITPNSTVDITPEFTYRETEIETIEQSICNTIDLTLVETPNETPQTTIEETLDETPQTTLEETLIETPQLTFEETLQETLDQTLQETLDKTLIETLHETLDQTLIETPQFTFEETLHETLDQTLIETPQFTFEETLHETLDQTLIETPQFTFEETLHETLDQTLIETPQFTFEETLHETLDQTLIETPQLTFEETLIETPQLTFEETFQETLVKTLIETLHETLDETFHETLEETLIETPQLTFEETHQPTFDETPQSTLEETLKGTEEKTNDMTAEETKSDTQSDLELDTDLSLPSLSLSLLFLILILLILFCLMCKCNKSTSSCCSSKKSVRHEIIHIHKTINNDPEPVLMNINGTEANNGVFFANPGYIP